jgi:hypothetical protein
MHFWRIFTAAMRSAPQKSSRAANDRTTRAASAGLTIADSGGASASIRSRRAPSSSIQNHGADCSAAVRVR